MASTEEQTPVNDEPTTTEAETIQENGEEASASSSVQTAAEEEIVEEGSLIKAGTEDEGKIFVGNLSWVTTNNELREYFATFGAVKDCIIKKDQETRRSRGFGFVLFKDPESVKKVLNQKEHKLDGRNIDPKVAQPPKKAPFKVFVGGLSPDISNEQLKTHFSTFGEIESFERPFDKVKQAPRGFCFISYKNEKAVNEARKEQFQEVAGKQCEVKLATPPQSKPGWPRPQSRMGARPNYNQGAWPQSQWGLSTGYGGYVDYFNSYNSVYGGYGGGMNYDPYDTRGWTRYGQGDNFNSQGQQQTQRSMYGGNNYRRGPVDNFKSY
ncbi:heterogeneous nuclear ribonucleoprotein A/B-like [Styela clava]